MKNVLDTEIRLPTDKAILIYQCGTRSIVYPPEYMKKKEEKNDNKSNDRLNQYA